MSVAFQQAPDHPVDDLVVRAARPDDLQPSLVLALAVRRSPDLVASDESTRQLVRQFVDAMANAPTDGAVQRLCLVVAGLQEHAQQLAALASHAAVQMDAAGFFDLIGTPRKFQAAVRKEARSSRGSRGVCAAEPRCSQHERGAGKATNLGVALAAGGIYATTRDP